MIKYQLVCDQQHEFEAWFKNSNTFDVQVAALQVECPHCGSIEIQKSVMAPRVQRRVSENRRSDADRLSDADITEAEITDVLRKFRAEVEARAQYVGAEFANEVRDMHHDDKPKRSVWGEATADEVRELQEDDIDVVALPRLPEDAD